MMQLGLEARIRTYLINILAGEVIFPGFESVLKGRRGVLLWCEDPGRVLYFK